MTVLFRLILGFLPAVAVAWQDSLGLFGHHCYFTSQRGRQEPPQAAPVCLYMSSPSLNDNEESQQQVDLSSLLTASFPTSIDDQVRQAAESIKRATRDGARRHSVRLLLPLIGPTELDDWPGGARQMTEAAFPLVKTILQYLGAKAFNQLVLDEDDGTYALLAEASEARDDSCAVLLPAAETIQSLQQNLEAQVGPARNLIIFNSQWKRRSDFGFFGQGKQISYVETYVPSYYCSNLMVEGEQVRILRAHPGPWRVFVRKESQQGAEVDWIEVAQKDVVLSKPSNWDGDPANKRDGGRLYDYGMPSYREIEEMIVSMEGYQPKSVAERAAAAFSFIKDTL